jgi:hypothetical protein
VKLYQKCASCNVYLSLNHLGNFILCYEKNLGYGRLCTEYLIPEMLTSKGQWGSFLLEHASSWLVPATPETASRKQMRDCVGIFCLWCSRTQICVRTRVICDLRHCTHQQYKGTLVTLEAWGPILCRQLLQDSWEFQSGWGTCHFPGPLVSVTPGLETSSGLA